MSRCPSPPAARNHRSISCFLFRPRKSCEKRRKRSHTNVSNASATGLRRLWNKRPTFAFTSESGYTLGFTQKIAHKGTHGETGAFRAGPLSLPSDRSTRSPTSPGRVSERCTLPLLRLDPVCSRRTQRAFGTVMRSCASLSRGVAAPLGCETFLLLSKLRLVRPALRAFPRVRDEGWYHHSWCALRITETPDGRLSKRLICHFPRSGGYH